MATKNDLNNTPFFKSLTMNASGIKQQRANLVAKQVIGVLESKIQALENDLTQIDLSISAHEDLSPDNKYSTSVASKDFQAEEWINQYFELLECQTLKQEELDIYKEIKRRQFEEEVNEEA